MLTDEQFSAYQTIAGAGRGNGGGRGANADGLTGSGEVWVMRDGEPTSIRVRTGLADTQYTEIQSTELTEGDEVIVRAVVLSND
jgi:HlyD family secretion protein